MQLFDILTAFNNWRTFGRPDPSATNRPWWNRYPTTNGQLPTSAAGPAAAKTDTYVPGNQVAPEVAAPVEEDEQTDGEGTSQPVVAKQPDGTYYYRREARLDYRLDLKFDLAAFARSVEQLVDGDSSQVENLIAAGFGLSADFSASGYERIATNVTDGEQVADGKRVEKAQSRSRTAVAVAERFAQQDRAYALEGFYRQAAKIRRSLHESVQDGHRRTTNRIALRFQMDTRFTFALAERFNVQTQQVAEQQPGSLAGYLDRAGQVATDGTADLMAKFFDAVDTYLAGSEAQIREQTEQFFTMAAEELGFDPAQVAAARDRLLGSIDSFFDRVSSALGTIESFYSPGGVDVEPGISTTGSSLPLDGVSQYRNELAVA
ncbi:MAG: hypothetical protein RBT76_09650 [candidate division Zixibacteria bacterium]|jgi:hypothetical protein|nr:hypothetical protein [candidate division Zixibacteria bacterium]